MSKNRTKFITMISLAALCVFFFVLAVQLLFPAKKAYAATSYSPSTVFSVGTGGTVGASEIPEGEEDGKSYIEFTFEDGGSVYYRRDLALKWFEAEKTAEPEESEGEDSGTSGTTPTPLPEGEQANPGVAKYFSMKFAFSSLDFVRFKISFESAEENITKEGKTTNSLLFRVKDSKLQLAVLNSSEQELAEEKLEEDKANELEGLYRTLGSVADKTASEDITVAFGAAETAGEFPIIVTYGTSPVKLTEGHNKFTNIGSNFMEYRSSTSTTPNTPITFNATLKEASEPAEGAAEGTDEPKPLTVLMKELNGQGFELDADGKVVDDTDPVLVLDEAIYAYTLGGRFNITYETIDVLDDVVQANRTYYMAKHVEPEEGEESTTDALPYKKPEEGDYNSLSLNTYFMPTSDEETIEEGYVSIRVRLDDGRGGDNYYVYLSWYVANEEDVMTLNSDDSANAFDCIKVKSPEGSKKHGPHYVGLTADDGTKTNVSDTAYDAAVEAYKEELIDLEKEGLSAGDGSYFYLPSLRNLITSDYADYRNLRFYIYYYNQADTSHSSETSLRYNALRFEIDKKGEYMFKVYAQDASGNAMRLYDKDGKLVDVSSENIWDIDAIPAFHFTVGYTGATIEKQKTRQTGYLDSTYSVSSFEIVALDYEAEYTLERLDSTKLNGKAMPDYEEFWKNAAEYVERYKDCLVEITAYDADTEKDDNDYNWNPTASSLSFRPQVPGIYVVTINLRDAERPGDLKTEYQVIRVDNPIDALRTKTNWLAENWLSVLFFSISAVLAIAIVVLFVVKPSEKKVEEVDLEKLKGRKK